MDSNNPIEQLREHARKVSDMAAELSEHGFSPIGFQLEAIANEIEAQYLKLPVDEDGVPIHIGDMLLKSTGAPQASYGEVVGLSDDSVWFDAKDGWESNWSNLTRHVKPDAVAEELARFLSACGDDDPHYYDEQIAEFAERIRKAVEQ